MHQKNYTAQHVLLQNLFFPTLPKAVRLQKLLIKNLLKEIL